MWLIAIYIVMGILCIVVAYLLSLSWNKNIVIRILEQQNLEYKDKMKLLEDERIASTGLIEKLKMQLETNKSQNFKDEETKARAFEAAKDSVISIGKNLTSQLLDIHKKENESTRQISEKQIERTTDSVKITIEKLVKDITILNNKVQDSTSDVMNIKNALLSPIATGQMAEITLSNVLNSAGLKIDIDYQLQVTFKDCEGLIRPDAVVFLPNNSLLIIDAKSSNYFLDIQNNIDSDTKLIKSMYSHLRSLASKDYQNKVGISKARLEKSNIMTLMFLPSEAMLEKINILDKNFMNKAWQQNIFPVGPSGLVNVLKISSIRIQESMRIQNSEKILEEISLLLDSFGSLYGHGQKLGNSIQQLINNYDKFAASFNRNFLSKANRLNKHGIGNNSSDRRAHV